MALNNSRVLKKKKQQQQQELRGKAIETNQLFF
jgi:hypothetical protein